MRLSDIAGAIALAAVLTLPAGLRELLASVPDRGDESIAARNAIAADRDERRRNAAARALCAESLGENSAPVWLADGSMRCANKRGRVVRTVNQL